jgi:very-short-patch-repair endonuclease
LGEGRADQRRTIAENESEETDSQREAFLREQQRLQVLRVSDDDVLKETEPVLFAILRAAGKEVV